METKKTDQEKQLDKLAAMAREAGMPRDQLERFLEAAYIPLPWQLKFHAAAREADKEDGPVDIGAGGARGPGKSHAIFSQVALDDCQRVKNLKGLFLRQTAVSAQESFDDLIDKTIRGRIAFEKKNNTVVFPNGSRILLGGFKDEKDIEKYVGIEYDFIVIEERNQLPGERIQKLKGSLRTSKQDWRPRMYSSFNPGGIGHTDVKNTFVVPHRLREEKKTRFIPSTYLDNPFLNTEYTEYLEDLTGDLGKAWREGEWDLFAGQYFSEWDYDLHVVEPFEIPKDWKRFKAGDAGYVQPSIGWYAVSPDGQLYRYRELYKGNLSFSQQAEECVALQNPDEEISYEVWDPAFWSKKGEDKNALSGADIYAQRIKKLTGKEPRMIKGNNSRVVGWQMVREYLRPYLNGFEDTIAKLQVFSTCSAFIEHFPQLQHDERNPEDVAKQGHDHPGDEVRYAIMSGPTPATTQADIEELNFKRAMMKNRKMRKPKATFLRT